MYLNKNNINNNDNNKNNYMVKFNYNSNYLKEKSFPLNCSIHFFASKPSPQEL